MIPLIRIFFIFDLPIYSQNNDKYAARRRILLQTSSSTASSHARILYHLYGFLRISSVLSRSPEGILLIIPLIQLASYYSDGSVY